MVNDNCLSAVPNAVVADAAGVSTKNDTHGVDRTRSVTQDEHALDALHTSLSCPICAARFSAPLLLTVCGHSFCAACIRENFDYQERTTVKEGGRLGCPLCRKACDHRDLVANVVLRDVVEEYGKVEAGVRRQLEGIEARERNADMAMERARRVEREAKRRKPNRIDEKDEDKEVRVEQEVVCLDDDVGSEDDLRSLSPVASPSSGEEYDPRGASRAVKGKRGSRTAGQNKATSTVAAAGAGTTTSSFVECPICGKNVHHMYMNSHVDSCLSGGAAVGVAGNGENKKRGAQKKTASQHALDVPPKLVLLGALSNPSNEKKLKTELKKYNISTEGCASARELLDRYMRFRTAVEVSNDKGEEGATYEKIIFRLMKDERSKKMAGMFGGKRMSRSEWDASGEVGNGDTGSGYGRRVCGNEGREIIGMASKAPGNVVIDMTEDAAREVVTTRPRFDPTGIDLSKIRHPREILLPEDATFEEMVAVTRLRDKVRAMLLQEFNASP